MQGLCMRVLLNTLTYITQMFFVHFIHTYFILHYKTKKTSFHTIVFLFTVKYFLVDFFYEEKKHCKFHDFDASSRWQLIDFELIIWRLQLICKGGPSLAQKQKATFKNEKANCFTEK